MPRCSTDEPKLAMVDGRDVACHLYDSAEIVRAAAPRG
jgi:hypothetical protein